MAEVELIVVVDVNGLAAHVSEIMEAAVEGTEAENVTEDTMSILEIGLVAGKESTENEAEKKGM